MFEACDCIKYLAIHGETMPTGLTFAETTV